MLSDNRVVAGWRGCIVIEKQSVPAQCLGHETDDIYPRHRRDAVLVCWCCQRCLYGRV
jgi:hypothetical protein